MSGGKEPRKHTEHADYSKSHERSTMREREAGVRTKARVLSASTLIGDDVRNRAEEELGKIEDFMIDLDSGCIAYAVLSSGGFLGIGDKLFAVPWNALVVDTQKKCFILDVDKETLKSAPGFDKSSWPDMADESWGRGIHEFYGSQPYWEATTRKV